jgi:hypothetical protein
MRDRGGTHLLQQVDVAALSSRGVAHALECSPEATLTHERALAQEEREERLAGVPLR